MPFFLSLVATIDGCSANCALPVARDLRLNYANHDGTATLTWDVDPLPSTGPQSYCKGLFRWKTRYLEYDTPDFQELPSDFDPNPKISGRFPAMPWVILNVSEQSASFTGLMDSRYYLFQIMHNFTCVDSRQPQMLASHLYRLGVQRKYHHQVLQQWPSHSPSTGPPVVTTPTHSLVVTEGDRVEFSCIADGVPFPIWSWAVDLIHIPITMGEQGGAIGLYTIKSAKETDQLRYWCVGTGFLVNPPIGKRKITDMTYIDLFVMRKLFSMYDHHINLY